MSSTRIKFKMVHINNTDIASDTNSGALRASLPLVSRAELTNTANAYAKKESPAVFPTQLKSPVQYDSIGAHSLLERTPALFHII